MWPWPNSTGTVRWFLCTPPRSPSWMWPNRVRVLDQWETLYPPEGEMVSSPKLMCTHQMPIKVSAVIVTGVARHSRRMWKSYTGDKNTSEVPPLDSRDYSRVPTTKISKDFAQSLHCANIMTSIIIFQKFSSNILSAVVCHCKPKNPQCMTNQFRVYKMIIRTGS